MHKQKLWARNWHITWHIHQSLISTCHLFEKSIATCSNSAPYKSKHWVSATQGRGENVRKWGMLSHQLQDAGSISGIVYVIEGLQILIAQWLQVKETRWWGGDKQTASPRGFIVFLLSEEAPETIISLQMRIDPPLPAGNVDVYKYLESMHDWRLYSVSIFAASLIGRWF